MKELVKNGKIVFDGKHNENEIREFIIRDYERILRINKILKKELKPIYSKKLKNFACEFDLENFKSEKEADIIRNWLEK